MNLDTSATTEIEGLERQIEAARMRVEQRDLAIKLEKNPDFRRLILDEFCVQECARFAREAGDPALDKDQRKDAMASAMAAGHLKRWLSARVLMGNTAEREIVEARAMIDEIISSNDQIDSDDSED